MTDHIKKLADARAKIKAKDEEIERWKELHGNDERCIQNQFTELVTLRAQVETLREALQHLVDTFGIYPNQKGLSRAVAALAATEPKG